jgi:hypothetical protein
MTSTLPSWEDWASAVWFWVFLVLTVMAAIWAVRLIDWAAGALADRITRRRQEHDAMMQAIARLERLMTQQSVDVRR